ncbi:MAG: PAS domain S-box protein [Vicinamibacterales bacterium]|jgi:PAS domain S-box-containing protein
MPARTVVLYGGSDILHGPVREALAGAGYSIREVPDWAACRAGLEQDQPDLVLVHDPAASGGAADLARQLRTGALSPDAILILLVDGGTPPADRAAALESGADLCLPRDVAAPELLAAVAACLRRKTTIDTLRASESRLRAIVETEPECVKVVSLDGRLLDMNPAGLRMIEAQDAGEVLGRPVVELVHAGDRGAFLALHQRSAAGEAGRLQFRIVGLRGTPRWVDTHSVPLRAADGTITSILSVTHDVTDRKRAEDALQQSEARFRELADNLRDVFYTFDPRSGRTLYVSPAYEQIWQRTCESLYRVPFSYREAVYPDDLPLVVDANRRQQQGLATDIEYRIRRPSGEIRWIRDHSSPVRSATGTFERVVGTAHDVTEHRLAGDRVREQASLLDKVPDAIMVRDLNQRITYWNHGAERMYGWAAAEATGRPVHGLLQTEGRAFQAACEQVVATGEWAGELQQKARHDRNVTVEGRWTLMRTPQGEPQSILAIETDITARKALELQILRAQRMDSIGTLAGGIAHDLNNILTPIIISVDLLKKSVTSDAGRRAVSTIGNSARRGAQLVGQVMSFARGIEGQRLSVAAADVIAEVAAIVRETFPKNIRLRITCEPGTWTLLGDPTQLHQVMLNLCVNARDAMPNGGELTLSAGNQVFDQRDAAVNLEAHAGPYAVLGVDDSGTGIPPDLLENIFDPFFTTKEVGKGTGLGLSTALAIIKGHGGFIRCDSTLGAGTRFRLHLPAQTNPVDKAPVDKAPDLPRGDGQTVLIVDDEAAIREVTRDALEAFGYRVLEAANGREGLRAYVDHQGDVDLVLVDMMMPVMDGATTIQALVQIDRAVRIVAISGVATDASMASAAASGTHHFLPKPFTIEGLLQILRRALTTPARQPPPETGHSRRFDTD